VIDNHAEMGPMLSDLFKKQPTPFGVGDTAEIANNIGRIVVGYASLEFYMFLIFAFMSDEHPHESFRKFFVLRSINKRQELFNTRVVLLPQADQVACKRLWRRLKTAADRRTEVAHSQYMGANGNHTRLHLVGDKAVFTDLAVDFFSRTISQYRTLLKDLLFFSGVLSLRNPVRWAFVVAQLPSLQDKPPRNLSAPDQGPPPQPILDELFASAARLGYSVVPDDAISPLAIHFAWGGGSIPIIPWKNS
jgi:hypothetical protein